MTFAHPLLALAAAAAIALPILIHLLLRFRRRPRPWAAMRFLMEAYQRQRRRLRLQQIILLATRCLLLAVAGAAIARPMFGGTAQTAGPRDVYLVIDNSLASQVRGEADDRTALERHIERAEAILRDLSAGDRAGIVTAASPADGFVLPPTGDRSSLIAALAEIEPTDAAADLEGALRLVRGAIEGEGAAASSRIVIVSELREGVLGGPTGTGGDPARLFQTPGPDVVIDGRAEAPASNVRIVEVEPQRTLFLGTQERTTVRVALRRSGPATGTAGTTTVRVALEPAGEGETLLDAGRATASWSPGQTETDVFVSVRAPTGAGEFASLRASIDRDRLAGDDVRRAPLAIAESVRVGVVDRAALGGESGGPLGAARWLSLALAPDRSSRLTPAPLDPSDLDVASLADLDAVFVLRPDLVADEAWSLLREFVERGRTVAIFPPADADAHPWIEPATEALGVAARVSPERAEHDPSLGVRAGESGFMLRLLGSELEALVRPVRVLASLPIELTPGEGEALLTLEDGTPWVARAGGEAAGEVLLFGSAPALEWTTLPATPLMVPLVQEVVRQSAGSAVRRRVVEAGSVAGLPAGASQLASSGGERITVAAGRPAEPLRDAGVYVAIGERGESLGPVIVAPAAHAGRTAPTDPERARAWFAAAGLDTQTGEPATESDAGDEIRGAGLGISGALFLAALALAALETILARRFAPKVEGSGS